jgi:hypothetical protein
MARRTSKSLTRSPPPDEASCGPAGHQGACKSRCIPRSVAGAYARVAGVMDRPHLGQYAEARGVCRRAIAARKGHRAPQPRPTSGTRDTKDSAASIRPAWWSGPTMWNSGFMGCWSWPLCCLALPWQRWWLTAHCRHCPAWARWYAAISCSSITATWCGAVTSVCVRSPRRALAVCRPRDRYDPRRHAASMRRRHERSRARGSRPAHDTQDRRALRGRTP